MIRTIVGGPYLGGSSRRSQKQYAREAKERYTQRVMTVSGRGEKSAKFTNEAITFTEADANGVHFPQSDALVIEAVICNHTVHRILIDNGSSVDILYADCLDKMGISRRELAAVSQPLYGFTGDSVMPIGRIDLPVTLGDRPNTSTAMSTFVVVPGGSQYNAVIGRPTLRSLRAVTSIYHQTIKFPASQGIGQVRGNQYESRSTYSEMVRAFAHPRGGKAPAEVHMVAGPPKPADESLDPRIQEEGPGPVEDLEEIQVDENEPSRKLRIGIGLMEPSKAELISFLKANLDVFAWTHEDMVGIDPDIICHMLNIDPK
ncbi:retropepsin-like domain-containing protein, partial [Salmonella enterica]|nr:retropepsin-like domain-containing protein [Salmonella enterica]